MATNFDENLCAFLTSCREAALKELKKLNPDYKELSNEATELSARIRNEIPSGHQELLEDLLENYHLKLGMEVNHCYLQGFRDCISLYKRLDGSFGDNRDLEKLFL